MKMTFLMTIIIVCLNACQNNSTNIVTDKNLIDTIENFDTFIARFYSDSIFQKTRIIKPLSGKITEWNDDESVNESNWSEREISITHYDTILKYMPNSKHLVEKLNNEFAERIFIENSGFSMERIFILSNGKWYLKEYNISNL